MHSPIQSNHQHFLTISKIISYLSFKGRDEYSLNELCGVAGTSELELQQVFFEWSGVSVSQFFDCLSKENTKKKIAKYFTVSQSQPLITFESMSEQEYKKDQIYKISYGIFSSIFGSCIIAVTTRGICKLAFFDTESEQNALINELTRDWDNADICNDAALTQPYLEQIFCHKNTNHKPIRLLLKGTPFQLHIWRTLLSISEGQLATYSQVAAIANKPKAIRALASAIGKNPIAYLIPCHRVIRSTGELSEYRWGKERKAAMIAKELSLQVGHTQRTDQ